MTVANIVAVGIRDATNGVSVWGLTDGGEVAWTYDTAGNTNAVVQDVSGNFYIVGKRADNGSGNRNIWKLTNEGAFVSSALIQSDAEVYSLVQDSNYLYLGTKDHGVVRIDYNLGSVSVVIAINYNYDLKIDGSGNLYACPYGTSVKKYNSSFVLQWSVVSGGNISKISLTARGDVVVGYSDKTVRFFMYDGSSPSGGTWQYTMAGSAGYGTRPVCDTDNDLIYAVSSDVDSGSLERIVCLNHSGTRQWGITTAYNSLGLPTINQGNIYIPSTYERTYNLFKVSVTDQKLYGLMSTNSKATLTNLFMDSDFEFSKVLSDEIAGFWKMNDDTGNKSVMDYSGNSRNGQSTKNTNVMSITGKINEALNLTAADTDEITVPTNSVFDFAANQDFTILTWFKWTGDVVQNYVDIFHKLDVSGTPTGYAAGVIKISSVSQRMIFQIEGSSGSSNIITTESTISGSPFDWNLVVFRVHRNGNYSISVNNGSRYNAGDLISSIAASVDYSNSVDFSIGGNSQLSSSHQSFDGGIDCVGFWDRILTEEEEEFIWNSGNGTEDFGILIILGQSGNISTSYNTNVELFITAEGTDPLTYQWYKNEILIPGETANTLSLLSVTKEDEGTYYCIVSDVNTSKQSNNITLTIGPNISSQSSSGALLKGSQSSLFITAEGTDPLTYQWYKNEILISGATSSTLTKFWSESDEGVYYCKVTNVVETINSASIEINVIPNVYIWNPFNYHLDMNRGS